MEAPPNTAVFAPCPLPHKHGVDQGPDDVTGHKARMAEMAWYDKFRGLRGGDGRNRHVEKTGDSERVEVRSRLVAREIKHKGTDSNFPSNSTVNANHVT